MDYISIAKPSTTHCWSQYPNTWCFVSCSRIQKSLLGNTSCYRHVTHLWHVYIHIVIDSFFLYLQTSQHSKGKQTLWSTEDIWNYVCYLAFNIWWTSSKELGQVCHWLHNLIFINVLCRKCKIIPVLLDYAKSTPKEKVIRVIIATFKVIYLTFWYS